MKKFLIITIALIMPMFLFGQSYSALWKQVSEAEKKDLPKTQYEVLQMIVNKADKEHQYGQLLKAELYAAQTMVDIAPDSLKPEVDRIVARYQKATDQVQRLVYQTVLWQIDNENYSIDLGIKKPQLTPELCKLLAATKERSYQPFVVMGADASVFGNDMLSVIGAELGEYHQLRDYYQKAGNLKAVSIIDAHLAIDRYNALPYNTPAVERIAFIDDAIAKWGRWPEINHLRNTKKELTNPQFHLSYPLSVARPMQAQQVVLKDMRHLSQLTMTVYPVRCEGDIEHSPSSEKGWAKIRPLLGAPVVTETKHFAARPEYELFEDSMTLKGLPVGMYLVEFKSNPATEVIRTLYHVTNVFTIAEAQPDGKIRYEVVNATTGQPIADAHLRIKERPHSVFAYTDTDKAGAVLYGNGRYEFYGANRTVNQTAIFTDRSIYRPGQTVHASAMVYQVENGINQTVRAHQPLKFVLRDANHKVVAEKQTESDAYGVGAVDFTLPAKGLTGLFTIQVENSSQSIRVEEYKRPTFHVDFAEYKDAYKAGDVLDIKGTALSYAGVPVQDAKVAYKVLRRTALWWWSYNRYYDEGTLGYSNHGTEICSGEATTDAEGNFVIKMPLEMPETKYTMFYNFVLQADVTDVAGETHQGQFTLPLGNRPTALSIDLDEKVLVEDNPQATFHLCNAAGKDIDAEVRYRIDGGEWISVRTNQQIALAKLASGKHRVEAAYEDQTINRTFVVFSLDDEQPATDTDDWFFQSATQFPGDGIPVTIQVGSSDQNVHIFYSIFSGFKLIEQGSVDKSNELINRKFTYQNEYENGLLLTFAWVKNGKCYTHTAQIQRPMPDKKLTLEWATFRDRLTPGQKEEWTLTIKDAKGNPVDANLMATLYDQSLDQLVKHQWNFRPYQWIALPRVNWQFVSPRSFSRYASYDWEAFNYDELGFSLFDHNIYPHPFYRHSFRGVKTLTRGNVGDGVVYKMTAPAMAANESKVFDVVEIEDLASLGMEDETAEVDTAEVVGDADVNQTNDVQVRENLNETAFFYPQLTTNANGGVAIKFTLPESLTTWQMLGFAHTCDLHYGNIQAEAVAKKDVMIQPNVPRFIREGDKATISARIFSEKQAQGKATLQLINAETNAIVYEKSQSVSLKAGSTTPVEFEISSQFLLINSNLLICKMSVVGKGFSDGEQHYLPVLPATERVTVSIPITQHQPGTAMIDLSKLVPADAKDAKLTLEYTNNPVWLMVQALPAVGSPNDDNAISLAASFYANGLGRYIINQNPQIKNVFELWKQEPNEASLTSQLEKNEDLKNLVLSETPWVMDADNETAQKHRLVDFFDENLMNNRLSTTIEKLQKLQNAEGAWTWFPGMPSSFYTTVAVSEMLVRLNALTEKQSATSTMLNKAFGYMGQEMVELVKELKKAEKKGEVYFPSYKALQWLYLVTLDGRQLPADVQQANSYLIELLKKDIKRQSIYDKALAAVIFAKVDAKRAQEYAQSLKEYTVYREDMGRYYDTPRAGYSWFDYKIPTQSIAIEALQQLTPDDVQTIDEMQRWLLQQKRTQAWDTPINSVNAVYAFLKGQEYRLTQSSKMPAINLDVRTVDIPKATAAIGYVKTQLPQGKRLTIRKTTDGTSWGAVYAQFFQQTRNIDDNASGLTIKREILNKDLKVGDRVKVRLTITADRDYDFVQVVDKRAACMEPVKPLSGYHAGAYITPRDNATCYFFGMLSKGTHVIETEYYIDRAGTYETGTATVECAYAPEFRAVTHSETLKIKH